MGQTASGVFFNGVGSTRLYLYSTAAGTLLLGVLVPLLGVGLNLGIDCLIYATLASNLAVGVAAIILARSRLGAKVDPKSAALILLASLASYLGASPVLQVDSSNVPTIAAQAVAFAALHLTLVPLGRGIGSSDIEVLTAVLGEMRTVGRVETPVLWYELYVPGLVPHD